MAKDQSFSVFLLLRNPSLNQFNFDFKFSMSTADPKKRLGNTRNKCRKPRQLPTGEAISVQAVSAVAKPSEPAQNRFYASAVQQRFKFCRRYHRKILRGVTLWFVCTSRSRIRKQYWSTGGLTVVGAVTITSRRCCGRSRIRSSGSLNRKHDARCHLFVAAEYHNFFMKLFANVFEFMLT